jgi:SEC-C motif-containing protein
VSYAACCGRWHDGDLRLLAPTAEALMRSRYTAYVLGLHGYLLETWHPNTRPAVIDADPPGLSWLGLEVRDCMEITADQSTVEFIAGSKLGGRANRLRETSPSTRKVRV